MSGAGLRRSLRTCCPFRRFLFIICGFRVQNCTEHSQQLVNLSLEHGPGVEIVESLNECRQLQPQRSRRF